MTMHSIKPEWDTPPNGDFASYVERLSASQALQSVRAQAAHSAQVTQPHALPGGVAPGSAQTAARQAAGAIPAPLAAALPPDLLQVVAPFIGMVRIARILLAVIAAVHALTLVMTGQGSWPVLAVMAGLWWFMGIVIKAASAGTVVVPLAAVKERQRQAAQQRKTGNKK